MRFMLSALACLTVISPACAQGNLSIDKLWVEFSEGSSGRADVLIRNDSTDRYYVTITTSEVLNPGSAEPERVTHTDPEKAGLLVTPNRLILDPGVMRAVRIVSLNEAPTQDRVYRVLVSPEVASERVDSRPDNVTALQVRLMAAYDVLVIARPKDGKADLQINRESDKITLINRGNTNVLLSDLSICPAAVLSPDSESCRVSESIRLYAGQSTLVPLSEPGEKLFLKTKSGPTSEMVSHEF